MKLIINSLKKSVLFKDLDEDTISQLLDSFSWSIEEYGPKDVIAIEGDSCDRLGIIVKGNVEIHKPFESGQVVTINHFSEGNIFGEALVFSGIHEYPATVISSDNSKVFFIPRADVIELMSMNKIIIRNFVGVLSNRILMLNDRITNLSFNSVRKKVANMILTAHRKQKTSTIVLAFGRKKMAEILNIPRPSLSRELINMKNEGLIDFHKNEIKILNLKSLEDSLIN